jgi:carbamoyl-phosphate synthase large subunit
MKHSILITSAGSKVPLLDAASNAASRIKSNPKVIAADSNPDAVSQYFSDEFWCMKPLSSYTDDELINELRARGIRFVLPTRDGELPRWSLLRDRLLREGIHVLVSGTATLSIAMDKLKFATWLQENRFQHIQTWTEPTSITVDKIVIKERFAMAPKNTLLNVNAKDAKDFSVEHQEPLFQELIEGLEISVDIWVHNSGETSCLARTRDLVVDGESRVTSYFSNPILESIAVNLSNRIGLRGPGVIQFILSANGSFYPIECNARVGGASTFSLNTKFDSLYLSLCDVFKEPPVNIRIAQDFSRQVRAMKDYYFK